MTAYDMTPKEEYAIERCCSWLDDEAIEICHSVATEAADHITGPEAAQEMLVKILTEVIVRNRRAAKKQECSP